MHQEIYNLLRAILLLMIFAIFAVYCWAEEQAYESIEVDTPPTEGVSRMLPDDPQETAQNIPEPKEITAPPEEPQEEWTSLGTYTLTAYCSCVICCDQWALNRPTDENGNPLVYTASGAIAEAGTTIAVDPRVIPYGTEVKINDHIYIAQDTGGAINGARIDIYFASHEEAWNFGMQTAEVFVKTSEN